MLEFFAILAVALAGGVLPLLFRWSHRQFHAALALSSGVFLGAVFLHLLPMVGAIPADAIMQPRPVGRGYVHLRETAAMPWPGGCSSQTS